MAKVRGDFGVLPGPGALALEVLNLAGAALSHEVIRPHERRGVIRAIPGADAGSGLQETLHVRPRASGEKRIIAVERKDDATGAVPFLSGSNGSAP